jgi:hypothetical protein
MAMGRPIIPNPKKATRMLELEIPFAVCVKSQVLQFLVDPDSRKDRDMPAISEQIAALPQPLLALTEDEILFRDLK